MKCERCGSKISSGKYCDVCLYTKDTIKFNDGETAIMRGKELIADKGIDKALEIINQAWITKINDILADMNERQKARLNLAEIILYNDLTH